MVSIPWVVPAALALTWALQSTAWCAQEASEPESAQAPPERTEATSPANVEEAPAAVQDGSNDRPRVRTRTRGSLNDRVREMTRALDLNPGQQAKLREILEEQRAQIEKVWNDPAIAPSNRTAVTAKIGGQTSDRIRAMLSDEQKKRYSPPKQAGQRPSSGTPSVEEWMSKTRSK